MHENAWLRTENQVLRQANEILSRRRNMKKARLLKKGMMTVEERRQATGQMNVDGQAVEESLRCGSQGRSVQAKERHRVEDLEQYGNEFMNKSSYMQSYIAEGQVRGKGIENRFY
ncbi:hypothetical protein FOWG_17574 [Fusarium oxysporum f. sp. lycopersici MN25]|nr:hypothetical protein FOWG_17574 [Fusarium oxysporum f. sp. lycopersici MN25]